MSAFFFRTLLLYSHYTKIRNVVKYQKICFLSALTYFFSISQFFYDFLIKESSELSILYPVWAQKLLALYKQDNYGLEIGNWKLEIGLLFSPLLILYFPRLLGLILLPFLLSPLPPILLLIRYNPQLKFLHRQYILRLSHQLPRIDHRPKQAY